MSAGYTIVAVTMACLAEVLAILSGAAADTAPPVAETSPVSQAAMKTVAVQILPNGLMSAKSAALYLGRSEKTMASWRHFHVGPKYTKVGGRVRYSKDALDDFVESGADVTRRDNEATAIITGLYPSAEGAVAREALDRSSGQVLVGGE
jgi:hypothetical protein